MPALNRPMRLFALLALPLVLAPTPGTLLAQPAGAPVVVVEAREQVIRQRLNLTGTVSARQNAQLSVATSGLVSELLVESGDRVVAGQPLLRLDDELATYQAQSANAQAVQGERALADARRRLDEARKLAPTQTIAETAVRDLEAEVLEDEAAWERARALAGVSQGILRRHELRAPFAGVISARNAELGEWVTPGDTVLELVSTERLRMEFQVSEDFLGRIGEDMPVTLYLAGDRSRSFAGRVTRVIPVADPTARTFLVRAEPDERLPELRPGVSVSAGLSLATGYTRIAVPRDAVQRYADGRSVVWVAEQEDGLHRARERLVEAGLAFDGLLEITGDVRAGELVVIEGNETLRPDQVLQLQPSEGP